MQDALARKLRVLRAERGLTLRGAEELTGVDKDTLSKLERGLRHPHDVTLSKIAKGYGVPIEELLAEEESALAGKAEAPETGRQLPKVRETFSDYLEEHLGQIRREYGRRVSSRLEQAETVEEQQKVLEDFRYAYNMLWLVLKDIEYFQPGTLTDGAKEAVGALEAILTDHTEGPIQREAARRELERDAMGVKRNPDHFDELLSGPPPRANEVSS